MTENKFAFGKNSENGCPCPLKAIGENPNRSPYTQVAERYDEIAGELTGIGWGTIPEDVAKEAWLDTLEYYDDFGPRRREIARETAAELGWLDGE